MRNLGWFCVLMVVVFAVHAGKVQRWVDENGQVHFGDAPPLAAVTTNYQVKERSKGDAADLERLEREFGVDPFRVGRVVPGMASHQVVAEFGRPTRRDLLGRTEVWEYDRPNYVTTRVQLQHGTVVTITDLPADERHLHKGMDQPTGQTPQAPRP